jgi:hypothetical protein
MALRIDLSASRILFVLQLGQLLLALTATLLLALDTTLAILLIVPIGVCAHSLTNPPQSPRALVLMDDEWFLVYDEQATSATLREQFHCSSWLQILEFKVGQDDFPASTGIRLVILPDCASSASRRQLRTVLRWYRFPLTAAGA